MAIVFNGIERLIEVTDPADIQLDAAKDIYSAWKVWSQDGFNSKYAPAFGTTTVFGGNPTIAGQNAPRYYFLTNSWRVLIDNGQVVSVGLNLYSEDFTSPYIVGAGSGISDRNSDAVSVNSADIQFASYAGGVHIDIDNITGKAVSGTAHPIGTARQPVNNLSDLLLILEVVGLGTIFVIGDLTITSPFDFSGYHFIGDSTLKTTITINSGVTITGAEFSDATITGEFSTNHQVKDCIITAVNNIGGLIQDSGLTDAMGIQPGILTELWSLKSRVPGSNTPVINMNNTGILSCREYEGGMKLINYSGTSAHTISLQEGQIKLDPATITSGIFVCRGIGKLINADTGVNIPTGTWNGGVTIVNELLTAAEIGSGGGGTSPWTTEEKDEVIQYSKKASDNAEQVNNKL